VVSGLIIGGRMASSVIGARMYSWVPGLLFGPERLCR